MVYSTLLEIELEPILAENGLVPVVRYGVNSPDNTLVLDSKKIITIDRDLDQGNHQLLVEFTNKLPTSQSMAVLINRVTVEGITLDRVKWAGLYYPKYPQPWASTQQDLPKVHYNCTHMGWSGSWELPFSTPIFKWIHQLDHLGWIYD